MQFRYFILVLMVWLTAQCLFGYEPQEKKRTEGGVPIPQGTRFPCWSPDGNWIAFSFQGDIWKMPAQGGKATRLTLHEADDIKPRWSPDGKQIAFSSNRSGNFDIWTIPSDGGLPTQITFHSGPDFVADWTPDGNWIFFYAQRTGDVEIWKVSAKGGTPLQITYDGGRDPMLSPDGKTMVYIRGEVSLWMRGYQGASNWEIYLQRLDQEDVPRKLTDSLGNELSPFFSADGKTIYFLRETESIAKDGQKKFMYNLWRMDLDGQNQNQVTTLDQDIFFPMLSKDGQKIILEKDFQIWQLQLQDGKAIVIPLEIISDIRDNGETTRIISQGNEMAHWSPDMKEIVFALDGDLWIMPAGGGKARQITQGSGKDQWPRFSPDGKWIAYYSDKSGNDDIYLLNLATEEERQLTDDKSSDFFHSWAPDSKSIVFTSERSGNRDIWIVELSSGIPQQITNAPGPEDDAVISPDGKWLAFDSDKSGNQEIWVMPIKGKYPEDAVQLTKKGNLTQVASWSPDSQFLAYEHNDARGDSSIWVIARSGGPSMQVVDEGAMPCWSPNGKWLLYEKTEDDVKTTMRIPAPTGIHLGERLDFYAEVSIDTAKERMQIFEQAWTAIEKGFYDPKLHGVDWQKIKKIYTPLAENARTDWELEAVINRMVGEVQASHMGIQIEPDPSKVVTGNLGWSLEPVPGRPFYQVKSVVKDGPADKAWIRSGDYVFEIAGKLFADNLSIDELLNNTIGKEIKIFISPTLDPYQGRYVKLTPVTSETIEQLQYHQWVRERIQMVKEGCEGKVIYIHLQEMNQEYLQHFLQMVQKTMDLAEGMILDVRNNGGGNIHQELLDVFIRQPYLLYQVRDQKRMPQPSLYWDKPVVLLVNERSFSDAEVFPYAFQALKIGYVVGMPTAGGVIGTHDMHFSNRVTFRVPQVGYYTLDGRNLEGFGVQPDFIVPETPTDRKEGRDPQLLKAMQVVLHEIAVQKQKTQAQQP